MSATGTKPKKINKKKQWKSNKKYDDEKTIAKVAGKVFTSKMKNISELKYHAAHDVAVGAPAIGTIVRLTDIALGDTDENRNGDKVTLTSMRFNYELSIGDSTNFVRVALFQWCDSNNNGDPIVSNCIQNNTYPTLSTWHHDSVQSGKIKILYDKVYLLDSDDPVRVSYVEINKGFKRNLQFEGGGPSARGHIYLLLLSDSAAAPNPTITYYCKTQFRDV